MLRDRRNCLRGRTVGFDGLRTWRPIGEPLRVLVTLANGCLGRGRGIAGGAGLGGACRSCIGDDSKISDNDNEDEVEGLLV